MNMLKKLRIMQYALLGEIICQDKTVPSHIPRSGYTEVLLCPLCLPAVLSLFRSVFEKSFLPSASDYGFPVLRELGSGLGLEPAI